MNKFALTVLGMLFCATAQSNTQHPGLTSNYDSVLQADINELRSSYMPNKDVFPVDWMKGVKPDFLASDKTPISFNNIKMPVFDKFIRADKHLDMELIYKTTYKIRDDEIIYILKDRVDHIKSTSRIVCEYSFRVWPDSPGNFYYESLKSSKEIIAKKISTSGFNAEPFVVQKNMLGFFTYNDVDDDDDAAGGLNKVLIDGRVVSLSIATICNNSRDKDQVIKDLTEWGELLIEANK